MARYNGLPHTVQRIFLEPLDDGARATMLKRLSAVYLAQSRSRMAWLIAALEPMAVVLVGLFVGFNIVALMLPLVSLITNLSS